MDGGSQIILANMLNEKRLICTYDQELAKPLPSSPYVLVDRKILCHCHIQSGLTYVLKNIGSCNSTRQPVLYYTVNLAFINYFASFLGRTMTQFLPLLNNLRLLFLLLWKITLKIPISLFIVRTLLSFLHI